MQNHFDASSIFKNASFPEFATRVCVVIPVQNEAEFLPKTLEALRLQVDKHNKPIPNTSYEVLMLVNNCTDNSYQIVLDYAKLFPSFRLHIANITLAASEANIGTVRRLLMDEALKRLKLTANTDTIIASTDGDTYVDAQWVYHIISEIDKGTDAVGGRILTQPNKSSARLHHLRDVTYRCLLAQAEALIDPLQHDPYPRHFQYFGANMAVTSKMYEQAGRLPQVPYLEDMAFHQALLLKDARIRKSCAVKVFTSSRIHGRVQVGFSEQLKKWTEESESSIPHMVEAVNPILKLFSIRSQLRVYWSNYRQTMDINLNEIAAISKAIEVEPSWLRNQLMVNNFFGGVWQAVEQKVNNKHGNSALQPIQDAITQLRAFFSNKQAIVFQTDPADRYLVADAINV